MSTSFEIPSWLLRESSPSPPPPPVDDHRVEDLVNNFIAGKQDALFNAPDAYYRTTGADAVDGAPAITQRLQDLRTATLRSCARRRRARRAGATARRPPGRRNGRHRPPRRGAADGATAPDHRHPPGADAARGPARARQ